MSENQEFKRDRTLECPTCEWWAEDVCEMYPKPNRICRAHSCAQHSKNIEDHAAWIRAQMVEPVEEPKEDEVDYWRNAHSNASRCLDITQRERDNARAELEYVKGRLAVPQFECKQALRDRDTANREMERRYHHYKDLEAQLAAMPTGPRVPFDPKVHKDGERRLCWFEGFVAVASWHGSWRHYTDMHLPVMNPTYVAELREVEVKKYIHNALSEVCADIDAKQHGTPKSKTPEDAVCTCERMPLTEEGNTQLCQACCVACCPEYWNGSPLPEAKPAPGTRAAEFREVVPGEVEERKGERCATRDGAPSIARRRWQPELGTRPTTPGTAADRMVRP